MPMYCIPFSFKDSYDVKDLRSTGGADAHYDIDFPARDHTLVARAAAEGRHHLREGEHHGVQRPRSGDPGGNNHPTKVSHPTLGYQRSTWAGNPCNAYDQTRAASIGSSSGSGVSVSTNLVMCSICEETGQSCRGPANHNSVRSSCRTRLIFLPRRRDRREIYNDRAGIHCRSC
jgi:hypothetical protein